MNSPARISNKLFISGSSLFASEEYFSILGHFLRFACHREVDVALAPCNREVSGHVFQQEKLIRKAPNPTARSAKCTPRAV